MLDVAAAEKSRSVVFLYAFEHAWVIYKIKTTTVRSRISSKLIFASCAWNFDRAYYGFSMHVWPYDLIPDLHSVYEDHKN